MIALAIKQQRWLDYLHDMVTPGARTGWDVNFPGRDPVNVTTGEINIDHNLINTNDDRLKAISTAMLKLDKDEDKVLDPYKLLMGEEKGKSYLIDVSPASKSVANSEIATTLIEQVQHP